MKIQTKIQTMFDLKQFTLTLIIFLIISLFKIIKQSYREELLENSLLDLKSKIFMFEDLKFKTEKLSSKLAKTDSLLATCLQNSEHLGRKITKTRETVDASLRSLKSSNSKRDACIKETSKILADKDSIQKEKDKLNEKVVNLEAELATKTARMEELASRLETIRISNNTEREKLEVNSKMASGAVS